MKLVFYNRLGMFVICATICLTLPIMVGKGHLGDPALAWVVGCALFLLDVSCRVRLYWVDPVPQDKILSCLSATAGGQLLCLPIWLWGCVIITAMLMQSPIRDLFTLSLILTDIIYRLRYAALKSHSPIAALIGGRSILPPLWLLACLLLVVTFSRSENLESSNWPSTKHIVVGALTAYISMRLVHKHILQKEQVAHPELTSETPLPSASRSSHQSRPTPWWQRMRQHFPWRQFVLGALIPMLIFYILSRSEQPLLGAVLAGSWGFGVVLVGYWRSRRIDLFAGAAMAMAVTELLVIVITRNPTYYLASEAIQSAAYGGLFLVSLAFSRSLIQCIAEETGSTSGIPDPLRQSPSYRTGWHILSAVWGGTYLLKAGFLLWAQWKVSLEVFLLIRALSGFPLIATLVVFSFWFPGRYWRRGRVNVNAPE